MLSELKLCFIPFALSRLLFFAVVVIVASNIKTELPARGGSIFHVEAGLKYEEVKSNITNILLQGDAAWYLEISKYSYPEINENNLNEKNTPKHWVFYPLFPIFVSILGLFLPSLISALIINSTLLLLSLVLLVKLGKLRNFDERKLKLTCYFLCFHPLSYFLSTPHSESVFLFLLTLTVYLIERLNKLHFISWALLLITRPSGILASPGLFIHYLLKKKDQKISILGFSMLLIPLSLFYYFLYTITGDPLISFTNQKFWGRETLNLSNFNFNNISLFKPWSSNLVHAILITLSVLSATLLTKKKDWGLVLIILLPLVVPSMGGSLLSIGRYSLALFPIYLGLVSIKDKNLNNFGYTYLAISSFIYGTMCLCYALGVSFALT